VNTNTIENSASVNNLQNILIAGNITTAFQNILTPEAIKFIVKLQNNFHKQRSLLLKKREIRQQALDAGELPCFLPQTEKIRNSEWKVSTTPSDLKDRRVEITGPVSRKMVINALNSGVKVFMADFEDSNSPTWDNNLNGQINLRDAVNKTITFENKNGKQYKLNDKTATLMVRPRGWHLIEKNIIFDEKPMSASLFDFGLYFFHNAHNLIKNGTGPYFYLPKLENHLEARLWNEVFIFAQNELNIKLGTIKVTVLIEHILAAFEMDEILYELKDHIVGLNCGRWDYIFSFIKKFKKNKNFILPDREQITMDRHFMKSYVNLLIQTCHKRGAHAIGGMAAQIPIKDDQKANTIALEKVKLDKIREAKAGHDGTWIAHPGLAHIAIEAFNASMPEANQINNLREDVKVTPDDLLKIPDGEITEVGIRNNIRVGLQYVEAWILGNGCVPLYNLMEDAATAEISRAQLWQWLHNTVIIKDGRKLTESLFDIFLKEELELIKKQIGKVRYKSGKFIEASELFTNMVKNNNFDEFLTIPAYKFLN